MSASTAERWSSSATDSDTAACETVATIAGQGSLALQNAALLRRLREGYPSSLRRSS